MDALPSPPTALPKGEGSPISRTPKRLRVRDEGWRLAVLAGLALALVGAFLLNLALGSVRIPLSDVAAVLAGGEASKASWAYIILEFRLPKALTAVLAGAALAVSGLQMQTLFRNPLADPYILGVSAGAGLGVALVVLSTGAAAGFLSSVGVMGDLSLIAAAIIGAGGVTALVIGLARWLQQATTLLILGLMLSYATSAVVSILIYFSAPEQIQAYIAWTFGSFGGVTWRQLLILAPLIGLGLLLAGLLTKPLNALLLGETYARSMGVNVERLRLGMIASTSLLAGVITAFCGPIAFLGVAVPHLCRVLLHTSDHRVLIPATLLVGGLIALLADLVAGLPGSGAILPLNAVTALLGAPVVIWILVRLRQTRSALAL